MKPEEMKIGVIILVIVIGVAACILVYNDGKGGSSVDNDKDDLTDQYVVIFNTLNGDGGFSQFVKAGDSITLPNSSTVSKQGYTLASWNEKLDGTGKSYGMGSKFTPDSDSTLYAIWMKNNNEDGSAKQYTVIFNTLNGNGGFSQYVNAGDSITLPDSSTVSKQGYILASWNEKLDGTGKSYGLGSEFTPDSNSTLYAIWKKDVRDVVFIVKVYNTTTIYQTETVSVGETVSVPKEPSISYFNEYYYFTGWQKQNGELWDFSQPIYEELALYAASKPLFSTLYEGFSLYLNMDSDVQKGWTHRISWGDGTTETYTSGPQHGHQYTKPGDTTVTLKSTNPGGTTYTVSYIQTILSDSVGKIVPAAPNFSPIYDYRVTDGAGNYLGIGSIIVFGHEIVSASINGTELDETKIDLMNSLRDLSNSVLNDDGKWIYEYTAANNKEYSVEYTTYRLGYGSSSYDILTEDGIYLEIHVGGSVNLHFVINEHYSRL